MRTRSAAGSHRITPKDSTPAWTDPYAGWAYSAAVISGDTATYTYTPAGAIASANNRWARVSRSYFPAGAIQADTQRIRTWDPNGSFELHKYVIGYGYDLAGRRSTLSIPQILIAPNYSNSVGYGYDPTTGLMTTVSDVEARVFRNHHDLAGRVDSLITPAGVGSNSTSCGAKECRIGRFVGMRGFFGHLCSDRARGNISAELYERSLLDSKDHKGLRRSPR